MMKKDDKHLGMDADISRRDFLNGVSLAVAGSALSTGFSLNADASVRLPEDYYPPLRSGLRGSHPGAFESAHALRDGKDWSDSASSTDTGEDYDLVVVGGGISGLATAWFYRRDVGPDARILIIENHDDFGGHAKRNEFNIDGQMLVDLGGTEYIEAPSTYPDSAKLLLKELGIDVSRAREVFDHDLYPSLHLRCGIFFDEKTFGENTLVAGEHGLVHPDSEPAYVTLPAELSAAEGDKDAVEEFLSKTPLSDEAREQVLQLFTGSVDYLPTLSTDEKVKVLQSLNYMEFLADVVHANDEVINLFWMWRGSYQGSGNDMAPALEAFRYGLPGAAGLGVTASVRRYGQEGSNYKNDFHFPDGNASVARMLVRDLIPRSALGNSMDDIVSAKFDYSELDGNGGPVQIRLNSTVVDVHHRGDPATSELVELTYIRNGSAERVRASRCVMACYHAMVPYVCRELPEVQKAALRKTIRMPLVSTNVLLKNWEAMEKLNIFAAYCPGSYFSDIRLTYPLRFPDYQSARSPDEPITLHMYRIPLPGGGIPAPEQFRTGRHELLGTSFDTFEREIRTQLDDMLGPGGFDPRRDIKGITVNRWPHGYAVGINEKTGLLNWFSDEWADDEKAWLAGRERFGRISFANSDAQASAMTESAIDQAWRATRELVEAN